MQLTKSKEKLQAAIGTGDHYWMATLILIVVILVCSAVIIERQIEVNNCWSSHSECRNRVEKLAEIKGELKEKNSHSLTLKERNDFFLNRTFSKEDQALKGIQDCEKRLRKIEAATRQHILNVTLLAGENQVKYNICTQQLAECEASKTPQSN